MRIIGLDLSLTAPGWFYRSPDGTESRGTWKPDGRGADRMHWIMQRVLGLLKDAGEVLVVIEGFAYGAKGQAVYEIAGIGWIVRYALWFRQIPVLEVPPPVLKKFATGKGNANKEIVIREVFKRWGYDAADNNEADAIVLGKIGACLAGLEAPRTAFQVEVLNDLRNKQTKEGLYKSA